MFVILGATGKIGSATISALRAAGAPVRAVVRDRSKAGSLAALGCEIATADLQDKVSLARAFDGASAVQIICPTNPQADDALAEMRRSIEVVGEALENVRPSTVLAISDYGAELSAGTGVTVAFHALEERLRHISSPLIILRSAEHMQNWSRFIKVVAKTGVLESLHHPLTKRFPTVSAPDVGTIAAELLLSASKSGIFPRIVHVEGPRRYTPEDVAKAMGAVLQREVVPHELPRTEWAATLRRGGLSENYAQLIMELYDTHNSGRIDAQDGVGEIRRGHTDLTDALRPLGTTKIWNPNLGQNPNLGRSKP